jgi:hypothetical protein
MASRDRGGPPSASLRDLSPQIVVERYNKGQDLGVRTPEEAKVVLEALLKSGKYDWYRGIAGALSDKGMFPNNMSADNRPFRDLAPSMDFISVVSISDVKNHQYYSGQRVDSLEIKIKANGHPITLLAPKNINFDAFIYNVGVGIQPYLASPLLKELKRIVVDPSQKNVNWTTAEGKLVKGTAEAHADSQIGEVVFFRGGKDFNPRVFHHEMGHLIADKLRMGDASILMRGLMAINPPAETAEPGDRFTALWKKQGSFSQYGSGSGGATEGFAEAWMDYMTNAGGRLPAEQLNLLKTLGISNAFSSSGGAAWMWPLEPIRPQYFNRSATKSWR